MGRARLSVDLLNPGQVFACLGLMEASELLCGPCEGGFDAPLGDNEATFAFAVDGTDTPLRTVLEFLRAAHVRAVAPQGSKVAVKEPGLDTVAGAPKELPAPEPDSPAALPIELCNGGRSIPVTHWADGSSRDNVKFWAGAGGYSGAALARDAITALAEVGDEAWAGALKDPFGTEAAMSSSFRVDWRRDYVPLALGFSINQQPRIKAVGFPFVELLAAIGLEHARPSRPNPRVKLEYRYAAWTEPLSTTLARAALGAPSRFPFPLRLFRMRLGWPGQEGQARCIVDAYEE
jgi:CRISPR-associated protein Csx14